MTLSPADDPMWPSSPEEALRLRKVATACVRAIEALATDDPSLHGYLPDPERNEQGVWTWRWEAPTDGPTIVAQCCADPVRNERWAAAEYDRLAREERGLDGRE